MIKFRSVNYYMLKSSYSCMQVQHLRHVRQLKGIKKENNEDIPSSSVPMPVSLSPLVNDGAMVKVSVNVPKPFPILTEVNKDNQYSHLAQVMTPLYLSSYEHQLRLKGKNAHLLLKTLKKMMIKAKVETFNSLNNIPCHIDAVKRCETTIGYRNVNQFSINIGVDGNPNTVGFFVRIKELSNLVCIPATHLISVSESHKHIANHFQNFIRSLPHSCYSYFNNDGVWKNLTVRSTRDDSRMVCVTINSQEVDLQEIEKIRKELRNYFFYGDGQDCGLTSLYLHLSASHELNSSESYQLLAGEPSIIEKCSGYLFHIFPHGYFEANTCGAETLYDTVKQLAQLGPLTTVLEVGCGSGNLSNVLSSEARSVIGIDKCNDAINNAIINSQINNISNTKFITQTSTEILFKLLEELKGINDVVAVINARQKGIDYETVQAIIKCEAINRIIYISSQPNQDSVYKFLDLIRIRKSEKNNNKLAKCALFHPKYVIPVDILPHTHNYTLVMRLDRQF